MRQWVAGKRDCPFALRRADILAGHIRGRPNDLRAKMPCCLESLVHPWHQGRGALRVGHAIVGIPHIDDDDTDLFQVDRFVRRDDPASFTIARLKGQFDGGARKSHHGQTSQEQER